MQEDPIPVVPDEGVSFSLLPLANHSQQQHPILHNTLFLNSPSLPQFPFIINSDFIPGIRDQIFWPGNSRTTKVMGVEAITNKSTRSSNGYLDVIPWVASQLPTTYTVADGQATGLPETMEAEEVEMMDTDEASTKVGKAFEFGGTMEGAEVLQHRQQQQHCLAPQHLGDTNTPVTW